MANTTPAPSAPNLNLVPSKVSLSEEVEHMPCFLQSPRVFWNGFDCPYFTKEQAEKVLTACSGIKWTYNPDQQSFVLDFGYDEPEVLHAVDTSHGKLYPIGAWAWCWQEDF
jgi:hypothetical protein